MHIVAFIGPSGTGKSHRALMVAHEHNIDTIIDDGLLIKNGKIIAGRSAKSEPNRTRAVKRAIFMDVEHAQGVRNALEKYRIKNLLILGTSENMINKIMTALGLPSEYEIVRIEEEASLEDIAKAKEMRLVYGRHIIPVPNIELRKQTFGYHLLGKLDDLLRKRSRKKENLSEKSVVRPAFSYYGRLDIADKAIEDMVRQVVANETTAWELYRVIVKNAKAEEKSIKINLEVAVIAGVRIDKAAIMLQNSIKDRLEHMTGMIVHNVNIRVSKIIFNEAKEYQG